MLRWRYTELGGKTGRRFVDLHDEGTLMFLAGISIDRSHPRGPFIVRCSIPRKKVACRTADEVMAALVKLNLPPVEVADLDWLDGR
jgi:hypothetical protein